MNYQVIIHPKAEKEIDKLHVQTGERVIAKLLQLKNNPCPHGYKNYVCSAVARDCVIDPKLKVKIHYSDMILKASPQQSKKFEIYTPKSNKSESLMAI